MLPHPPRLGAFEKEDEMKPIPLFESDESVEDLCLLIKSLHEEVSTMHRKVDVLLAVTSPALSVVPNEDEAMPVVEETLLASCPTCGTTAYTDADVERFFGYRTSAGKPTIVQSWCRECRKLPPLPADVTALGAQARKLLKDATKLEAKAMTMPPVKRQEMMTTVTEMRAEGLPMEAKYKKLCEANRTYNRKPKGTK
jgi:hypothetical protein